MPALRGRPRQGPAVIAPFLALAVALVLAGLVYLMENYQ